jgi:hypothetical protein
MIRPNLLPPDGGSKGQMAVIVMPPCTTGAKGGANQLSGLTPFAVPAGNFVLPAGAR